VAPVVSPDRVTVNVNGVVPLLPSFLMAESAAIESVVVMISPMNYGRRRAPGADAFKVRAGIARGPPPSRRRSGLQRTQIVRMSDRDEKR
jgi:hypothetical protein